MFKYFSIAKYILKVVFICIYEKQGNLNTKEYFLHFPFSFFYYIFLIS